MVIIEAISVTNENSTSTYPTYNVEVVLAAMCAPVEVIALISI
jgi:hypothetical protein